MLHKLLEMSMDATVVDAAERPGGTWNKNRYPEPAVSGPLKKPDLPKTPRNRVFFRVDGRCAALVHE